MPISIAQAQKKASSFLDTAGDSRDNYLPITKGVFEQYGSEFLLNMGKFANRKKVVASGKLLSNSSFKIIEGTRNKTCHSS